MNIFKSKEPKAPPKVELDEGKRLLMELSIAAVRVNNTWNTIGIGRERVSSPELQEAMILLDQAIAAIMKTT